MKKMIVALLVVVILVMTNPSPQRHQAGIHAAIREAIGEKNPLASALVGLAGASAVLFGGVTAYQSFGVVSYTTFHGEVMSVGFCGYVWVSPAVTRPQPRDINQTGKQKKK